MHELIQESLPQFAASTNHYRLADGRYVLVTVPEVEQPLPHELIPVLGRVSVTAIVPAPTEVFLADANARPVDSDGDPTNGLTPLLRLSPGTTHEQALDVLVS